MFENLGGVWADVENDWKLVKNSIDQKRPELEMQDLRKEIDEVFQSTSDRIMPKGKISEIQKTLKKASAWAHAKELGKAFIPSGDPIKAFERTGFLLGRSLADTVAHISPKTIFLHRGLQCR